MGRLDDAAKRKVVELREAGLSFRKIKAVLELENIKVSAQAIYLFLKEFHGRGRQNDAPVSGNGGPTTASGSRDTGLGEPRHGAWSEQQLRNLLREAAHVAGFSSPSDSSGQSVVASEPRGHSSGTGPTSQEPQQGDRKDEDVRIISVTSLAQNTNHDAVQTVRSGFGSGAIAGTFSRRRYTPSPANPVLVARKRLLDKALFHRARVRDSGPQSAQQTVSLVRRDQSCFPYSEGRKVVLPQTSSFNPTSTRTVRGLHPGNNLFRQGFQQRANIPTRSTEQSPRVGIRIPVPGQSSTGPQNVSSSVRAPALTSQQQSPSQQSNVDTGTLSALQEQVKSLATEVRSLGLALRMMVEQQGRLEREQSQQTQVQKQILTTLQKLASKQGPCGFQHSTTSTLPPCPLSSASFSQSTFTPSQGSSLCSQAQSRYNEIDGSTLDNIEPFSLDTLSSATIDGFQTSDSLSFNRTHSPTFTQSHTQQFTPEIVSYTQSHTDTYAGIDSKPAEIASPNTDRSFQACRSSSQSSTEPISVHDAQLTIVKIENV
ncbi:uncharacterized protein LOC131365792 [Hemibagrus wyckioides]|nr:uncharacterized protein LOC131365792 [Hemibagrus wyckioides]XP_058265647.1 uncharacterized protein LOC131365792 [Hemibagrus wyckioides]